MFFGNGVVDSCCSMLLIPLYVLDIEAGMLFLAVSNVQDLEAVILYLS